MFLVFDINHFAPSGGFGDFVGSFKSVKEAIRYVNTSCGGGSAQIIEIDNAAALLRYKFTYQRVLNGELGANYELTGREVFVDNHWTKG